MTRMSFQSCESHFSPQHYNRLVEWSSDQPCVCKNREYLRDFLISMQILERKDAAIYRCGIRDRGDDPHEVLVMWVLGYPSSLYFVDRLRRLSGDGRRLGWGTWIVLCRMRQVRKKRIWCDLNDDSHEISIMWAASLWGFWGMLANTPTEISISSNRVLFQIRTSSQAWVHMLNTAKEQ